MARGGKRDGAGRRKGSQSAKVKARKELAEKVTEDGISPLEVLLHVIGGFTEPRGSRTNFGALVLGVYDQGKLTYIGHTGGGFKDKDLAAAVAVAIETAPYCHQRLAPAQAGASGGSNMAQVIIYIPDNGRERINSGQAAARGTGQLPGIPG